MAKLSVSGLAEYQKAIQDLGNAGVRICKLSVYDGARVIADAVRRQLGAIPAMADWEALVGYARKEKGVITESQKSGLLESMTLTDMRDKGGEIYTKLTWAGYNSTKTRSFPQGQPNLMIAASVEMGTSARRKQPFVRPAVNAVKARAVAAMEKTADAEIKKIMGG